MNPHLLTILIFLPLFAAAVMLVVPASKRAAYKYIALITGVLELILSGGMYKLFNQIGEGITQERHYLFVDPLQSIRLDLVSLGGLDIDNFIGVGGLASQLIFQPTWMLAIASGVSGKLHERQK